MEYAVGLNRLISYEMERICRVIRFNSKNKITMDLTPL